MVNLGLKELNTSSAGTDFIRQNLTCFTICDDAQMLIF